MSFLNSDFILLNIASHKNFVIAETVFELPRISSLKKKNRKKTGAVAQVEEHLLNKWKVLSSSSSITKKKNEEKETLDRKTKYPQTIFTTKLGD